MKFFVIFILAISFIVFRFNTADTDPEVKILPYELSGNQDSDTLLIFLHGYPNNLRMWDRIIEEVKSNNLCLNISYPNFHPALKRTWGLEPKVISELIKVTIDQVLETQGKSYKVVMVAHDWGAFFAYLFEKQNPSFLTKLVTLDIGLTSFSDSVRMVPYQIYLATAFAIGGSIGKYMTYLFIESNKKMHFGKIFGMSNEELMEVDASWNYLYYQIYRNIIYYGQVLKGHHPACPIAYVYGKDKPYHFHGSEFIDRINNAEDGSSEIHEVDGGHWVMDKSHQLIVDLIKKAL